MHIDTKATIGSLKDAILDKLQIPPYDPTLHSQFYEDARAAMSKQSASQAEVRAMPKAFVARAPKKTIKDVMKAEREIEAQQVISAQSPAASSVSSPPPPRKPRRTLSSKAIPAIAQARAILGGDPGFGGQGTMGSLEAFAQLQEQAANITNSTIASSSAASGSVPSKAQHTPSSVFDESGQDSSARYTSQTSSFDSPALRRSIAGSTMPKSSGGGIGAAGSKGQSPVQPTTTSPDPADLVGLDAYVDYLQLGLPGNQEAKKLEEAAMAAMNATFSTPASSSKLSFTSPFPADPSTSNFNSPAMSSPYTPAQRRLHNTEELDEESGQRDYEELVARSRSFSIQSNSSSDSNPGNLTAAKKGEIFPSATGNAFTESTQPSLQSESNHAASTAAAAATAVQRSNSTLSAKGARERARSGTIMQDDYHRKAAAGAIADVRRSQGTSTPSTINTGSSDAGPSKAVARSVLSHEMDSERRGVQSRAGIAANVARRLAGINTDEISSWRDAQHVQARYYAIHSYSNGHVLEDWRTVAAFRIRPFELLEVQFADPRDKVHIPRVGEASTDHFASRQTGKGITRPVEDSLTSSNIPINPSLDCRYLEPFAEGWGYIFKRGGGTSKAQKAGLGLWKLRWISLRGNSLSIFRVKPARHNYDEALLVWNLESIDFVISEKADGVTRPLLLRFDGLCEEILTLSFQGNFIPPNSVHDEAAVYTRPTLSIRFVTQTDHCTFWKHCARAHLRSALRLIDPERSTMVLEWRRKAFARATVAGMGGTVAPGRPARKAGRNALVRARLRPTGVTRLFDDADRWSSSSETEDVLSIDGNVQAGVITSRLIYTEAALSLMSYVGSGGGGGASGGPPTASTASSRSGREEVFSPVRIVGVPHSSPMGKSSSYQGDNGGRRRRGFTAGYANNESRTNTMTGGQDSKRDSFRLQMPNRRVGLGMSRGGDASPLNLSNSQDVFSSSSRGGGGGEQDELSSSPSNLVALRRSSSSAAVISPRSPIDSMSNWQKQRSSSKGKILVVDAEDQASRMPPLSPPEEDESPAAQALHSFLAQRSTSNASGLNRARSSTIGATPEELSPRQPSTAGMSSGSEYFPRMQYGTFVADTMSRGIGSSMGIGVGVGVGVGNGTDLGGGGGGGVGGGSRGIPASPFRNIPGSEGIFQTGGNEFRKIFKSNLQSRGGKGE